MDRYTGIGNYRGDCRGDYEGDYRGDCGSDYNWFNNCIKEHIGDRRRCSSSRLS